MLSANAEEAPFDLATAWESHRTAAWAQFQADLLSMRNAAAAASTTSSATSSFRTARAAARVPVSLLSSNVGVPVGHLVDDVVLALGDDVLLTAQINPQARNVRCTTYVRF